METKAQLIAAHKHIWFNSYAKGYFNMLSTLETGDVEQPETGAPLQKSWLDQHITELRTHFDKLLTVTPKEYLGEEGLAEFFVEMGMQSYFTREGCHGCFNKRAPGADRMNLVLDGYFTKAGEVNPHYGSGDADWYYEFDDCVVGYVG